MSSPTTSSSPLVVPTAQGQQQEPSIVHDPQALNTISILERVGSVLSLLGCLFVIVTFLTSHAFHKPINRLVFYASFGNLMTNMGTLMSRAFVNNPNSGGCQFQAFLIQMFMPADALFTLSMAVNVYLTFYQKFDARRLRRMDPAYIVINYGVPFVPAFVYIFVRDGDGHRVYGDAALWCWVSREWAIWRVITFYAPVWFVIVATMSIYFRAWRTIYNKRKQLHEISRFETDITPISTKTTEVSIASEVADSSAGDIMTKALTACHSHGSSGPNAHPAAYSVTVTADGNPNGVEDIADARSVTALRTVHSRARRRRSWEVNNAALSYTKCALLFFTAMLITWIPSSANRVYSVFHDGESIEGLEYAAGFVLPLQGFWNCLIYIMTSWSGCKSYFQELGFVPRRRTTRPTVARSEFGIWTSKPSFDTEELWMSRSRNDGVSPVSPR